MPLDALRVEFHTFLNVGYYVGDVTQIVRNVNQVFAYEGNR